MLLLDLSNSLEHFPSYSKSTSTMSRATTGTIHLWNCLICFLEESCFTALVFCYLSEYCIYTIFLIELFYWNVLLFMSPSGDCRHLFAICRFIHFFLLVAEERTCIFSGVCAHWWVYDILTLELYITLFRQFCTNTSWHWPMFSFFFPSIVPVLNLLLYHITIQYITLNCYKWLIISMSNRSWYLCVSIRQWHGLARPRSYCQTSQRKSLLGIVER